MQIDFGLSRSNVVEQILKKHEAIKVMIVQKGRAMVMKASPKFVLVL